MLEDGPVILVLLSVAISFLCTARVVRQLNQTDTEGDTGFSHMRLRRIDSLVVRFLGLCFVAVVIVCECGLLLLQTVGLADEVEGHDLDHVGHLVVGVNLGQLVKVVEERVLCLVDFEHI